MMKNKLNRALGLSIIVAGMTAGVANAADTVTANASVTVLSTINIVNTTPMSFGTIAAFGDGSGGGDTATLTMPADGSATSVSYTTSSAEANVVEIVAGNVAQFDITGAAPNTVINVTLPGAASTLTDPAGGANTFSLDNFTKAIITSGTAFTYDTDATGALSFAVGADLITTAAGLTAQGEAYGNSTYTGTYDVTVSY